MFQSFGVHNSDGVSHYHFPANTSRLPNAGRTLAHRLQRWPNISPTLGQRLVLAELPANKRHYTNTDPKCLKPIYNVQPILECYLPVLDNGSIPVFVEVFNQQLERVQSKLKLGHMHMIICHCDSLIRIRVSDRTPNVKHCRST